MTDAIESTEPSNPAITCTLSDAELTDRRLEWSDLGALALTTERIAGGVASTFPLSLRDAVEDLASREMSCCGSWMHISSDLVGDVVRLELTTTNPDGLATILSMSGIRQ